MRASSPLQTWAPKPSNPDLDVHGNDDRSKETTIEEAKSDPTDLQLSLPPTIVQFQDTEAELRLFKKLPLELRDKIWKLSLPGPRIVRIYHDPKDMAYLTVVDMSEIEAGVSPFWRAKAVAGPVSVLLHINKESRSIAKKYYKLMFAKQTLGRPVYFDVTQDTLCLTGSESLRAFYGRQMHNRRYISEEEVAYMANVENSVRFLAIFRPLDYISTPQFNVAVRFPSLESLTMTAAKSRWGSQSDVEECFVQRGEILAYHKELTYKEPKFNYLEPAHFASLFLSDSVS